MMDTQKLIGMRVMNISTHAIGTIEYIRDGIVAVDYHGTICKYSYPSAFAGLLELEDEELQEEIRDEGVEASFDNFKRDYRFAINNEIDFLKATGGKKYKIIDGGKLPSKSGEYFLKMLNMSITVSWLVLAVIYDYLIFSYSSESKRSSNA